MLSGKVEREMVLEELVANWQSEVADIFAVKRFQAKAVPSLRWSISGKLL
jgi:hypothetical protein